MFISCCYANQISGNLPLFLLFGKIIFKHETDFVSLYVLKVVDVNIIGLKSSKYQVKHAVNPLSVEDRSPLLSL